MNIYLVEEQELLNGNTLVDVPFRRMIKAAGFKIAFAAASRIAAKKRKEPFRLGANDLAEVVEGYLWGCGDGDTIYEVRCLSGGTS